MALDKLYLEDSELLDYRTEDPLVAERCLSSRLAMYLQKSIKNYKVDCEYNRHGECIKEIDDQHVFPDIIIHERKVDNKNLAWIELKKENVTEEDKQKDRNRLLYVTSQEKKFKYKYGFLIIISKDKDNTSIELYINGKFKKILSIEQLYLEGIDSSC